MLAMIKVNLFAWFVEKQHQELNQRLMTRIDPQKPIAWLGDDRLLLDDITVYGLRRRVLARKGDLVNLITHMHQAGQLAGSSPLNHWMFEKDDFYYLWIVWKDKRK